MRNTLAFVNSIHKIVKSFVNRIHSYLQSLLQNAKHTYAEHLHEMIAREWNRQQSKRLLTKTLFVTA
jgi:hypothetical protein